MVLFVGLSVVSFLINDQSVEARLNQASISIQLLSGAEEIVWSDRDEVAQVVIHKPEGTVRMLWSRVPSAYQVTVPALSPQAEIIDMWGNAATQRAVDGTLTVELVAGECRETEGDYCMIGGPPVYVLESVVSPKTPELIAVTPIDEISTTTVAPITRLILPTGLVLLIIAVGIGLFLAVTRGATRDNEP